MNKLENEIKRLLESDTIYNNVDIRIILLYLLDIINEERGNY